MADPSNGSVPLRAESAPEPGRSGSAAHPPPRRVVALINDLLFESRIRSAVEAVNLELLAARRLDSLPADGLPAGAILFVVDMEWVAGDPAEAIRTVRRLSPAVKTLAFYPHVRSDLRAAARSAGADYVVPRSRFAAVLHDLLSKQVRP